MQLAYVSTGSFISPGGRSLSGAFPGQRERSRRVQSWAGGGEAQSRQRCLNKRVFDKMMMMCIGFSGIFVEGCQKLKVNVFA